MSLKISLVKILKWSTGKFPYAHRVAAHPLSNRRQTLGRLQQAAYNTKIKFDLIRSKCSSKRLRANSHYRIGAAEQT